MILKQRVLAGLFIAVLSVGVNFGTTLEGNGNNVIVATIVPPKCSDGSDATFSGASSDAGDYPYAGAWYCHGREIEEVPQTPIYQYVQPRDGDHPWGD